MTIAQTPNLTDHVASWNLSNGIRVVFAEMRRVPRVEVRLRWKWPHSTVATDPPRLSASIGPLIARLIVARERRRGGSASVMSAVSASADLDRIAIGGGVLVEDFGALIAGIAAALTTSEQPLSDRDFDNCLGEISTNLSFANSRPRTLAMDALTAAIFKEHPYAHQLGDEGILRGITQAELLPIQRALRASAPLVVVVAGDVARDHVADLLDEHLGDLPRREVSWESVQAPIVHPPERIRLGVPSLSQSTIALGRLAPSRNASTYPAVLAAQLLLGGYAGSHLVRTLREEHSLVYQPSCNFEHGHMGSALSILLETRNGNIATVRSLLESELDRYDSDDPRADECREVAATFSTTLGLSVSSQTGMASTLAELECGGLTVDWMAGLPARLRGLTPTDVGDAWRKWLAGLDEWSEVDLLANELD
jgi:zinc protease